MLQTVKTCNCKNSKCIKLYCQCYANKQFCNKNCHCLECLNHDKNELLSVIKSSAYDRKAQPMRQEDLIKSHKGCACKKSGCMKKYCECFQAGIICTEACKCVDWYVSNHTKPEHRFCKQSKNSERVKEERLLKQPKYVVQNNFYSDKILLSQNQQQYNAIVEGTDKNSKVDSAWLDSKAAILYGILSEPEQAQKHEMEVQDRQQHVSSLECRDKMIEEPEREQKNKLDRLVEAFLEMLKQLNNNVMDVEI